MSPGCSLNDTQISIETGRRHISNWHRHAWRGKRESRKARSGQFGQWRDLQDDRGLELFDGGQGAFDRSTNQLYHARNFVFVNAQPNVPDYSPMLDAAFQQLRNSGGGTLVLGNGDFPLSKPLKIPSYCCVQGQGHDQTVLRAHNLGNRRRSRRRSQPIAVIEICEAERVSLFDLTIDGEEEGPPVQPVVGTGEKDAGMRQATNRLSLSGVRAVLSNYVCIRGVRVIRMPGDCFAICGRLRRWSFFADVEDCVAEQCGGSGFIVQRCFYVSVRCCAVTKCGRNGVSITGGARVVLISNGRFQNIGKSDAVAPEFQWVTLKILEEPRISSLRGTT